MKSPIRSATLVLFPSMPGFYRRITCRTLAPALLFSIFLLFPLGAEAGLPQVAISIPTDQSFPAGFKAAERCDVPGKLIVLPPLAIDFASGDFTRGDSLSEEQAVQSAPAGSEFWLHVVAKADSIAGKESEQEISERVDAFVKSLPLSAAVVRGVVVEIKNR
jgi:hypothetical protein